MPRSAPRWASLAAALAEVERWVLPGACLLCHGPVGSAEGDALVCGVCRSRWRPVPSPRCPRCGQPVAPAVECRICADWPAQLRSADSAVWLDGPARRAVHLLKYEGWHRIADGLGPAMRTLAGLADRPLLVPVPLGSARERERGYNQSERLARSLGRLLGCAVDATLLRRSRETTTQTRLTPEARTANVRGAFVARRRSPPRVVLVDDVFTTGATLVAAALGLIEAGARDVGAVTFARADLPLAATSRSLAINLERGRS